MKTKKMNYTEITSIEKVFEAKGLEPTAVPDFSKCPENYRQPFMDHYLMCLAIDAINPEGFIADLTNFKQDKYYLWPDIEKDASKPSGFGFSCNVYAVTYSFTDVGARRAFADRARARHFWKHFQPLYESYTVIKL